MIFDKDWKSIIAGIKEGEFERIYSWFYRKYFSLRDHQGYSLTEDEWDYLIILDACRYDMFKEVNWLDGELSKRISPGSQTVEFLNKTFTDYYYNTVYVTASPHISNFPSSNWAEEQFMSEEHFPYVNPVYSKEEYDEKGVSSPEGVTKEAIKTHKEYPDSRMIVHYVQPHAPYIGEGPEIEGSNFNKILERDNSWQDVKEAYKANLERALTSVEELIDELDGKIVITADHGEIFGKYGLMGHPPKIHFKELVEVPWFVVEKEE